MGRLFRIATWFPAAAVLFACSATAGNVPSRPSPVGPADTNWVTPECHIADTTASPSDQLFVVGEVLHAAGSTSLRTNCNGPIPIATRPLAVVTRLPPFDTDLRELIDAPVGPASLERPDVLVTRDPVVLAYGASRADFMIEPLPWTTTYVIATATQTSAQTEPTLTERDAIARDAVTADVRGAVEPFAWRTDASCMTSPVAGTNTRATTHATTRAANAPSVIAFAANDVIAQQLAERMVSLLNANERDAWIAAAFGRRTNSVGARIAPVPTDSLDSILATGRAIAAVLPIARDPRTPCTTRDNAQVPLGAIPLVDSRAHVLVRRGSGAAFFVAPDGTLQFIPRARP